ncbi:sigma-70 family RNA polymerase sigma factor [Pararobbsia silviterrae]|uniref:Sigma-70 family RNA polymerase sigma factor n=1 Tax=Pararobbsia silviterrae TaxID=1792498 RepID=A0A494XNG9_9BURK|nr:sigma-70 family RNA polymerase sigma factor [Pararobbsia silviterrae]RKP49659.1 sigma-70 family RNA polymerase sigma factor [Pararobbsia silviterrae]
MSSLSPAQTESVSELYAHHHAWLRDWLRKRLGNAFDAADLAHDTYVRVISAGITPPQGESRRYLTQIAKGLAIDFHRRRRIETAYIEALALNPPAEAPSEEARALIIEALVELDAVLHQLAPKVRQAFLLCRLDGLSYREIASQLGVSLSSVEKYVATGLRACYALCHGAS